MSFLGIGGQDWVEQDVLGADASRGERLLDRIEPCRPHLLSLVGCFELTLDDRGRAEMWVEDALVAHLELDAEDRLVFTRHFGPDAPL